MKASTASRLVVAVYYDLVCPWCLIGKRNLARAVEDLGVLRPEVAVAHLWRPVELLPDTPSEGLPYEAFYEHRLGGAENVARRRSQIQAAGRAAGVEFAFDRIESLPNTSAAHGLVEGLSRTYDEAAIGAFIDRLFAAYFTRGQNIGAPRVLLQLARASGLDVVAGMKHADDHQRVSSRSAGHPTAPVAGVPAFIFEDGQILSGAHAPEVLLGAMLKAIEEKTAAVA